MGRELWTDTFLDGMRHATDEVADTVVAAVYESGKLDAVNRLLTGMLHSDAAPPEGTPQVVDRYLLETAALPDWADPEKVHCAEHLFSQHGLLASAILCCASLPECYLDKEGVPALASTQRLKEHVYRRIWETSHMVISVMQPGGLARGGDGVRACQRVRLMHAAIRQLLLSQGVPVGADDQLGHELAAMPWDTAKLGKPLNEEDMAYVLLTFSYVGVRGLETLGVEVTHAEREAYVHAWNVVGHLMGIRRGIMAESYEDARWLFEKIKARRKGESPDGKALTKALMDWMDEIMPPLLKNVPELLICELIGKDDAALLGVRRGAFARLEENVLRTALRAITDITGDTFEDVPLTRHAAEVLFRLLVKKIWRMDRQWHRELFAIPPALQQSWRLA